MSFNNIFCSKCGAMWTRAKDGSGLICPSCGARPTNPSDLSIKFRSKLETTQQQMSLVLEKTFEEEDSLITITCPRCGNDTAFFRIDIGTKEDFEEIVVYKCTKCGYSWKEN